MKRLALIVLITVVYSCSKEKKSERAGEKMQEFVVNISSYAKKHHDDFIIIPQNGIELAFNNLSIEEGVNSEYIASIDGMGVEELFYNGDYNPDEYRLDMLKVLKQTEKILVSEYIKDKTNIKDAIQRNESEGFICFPRTEDNYYYSQLSDTIMNENADNITSLNDVKNYLYLINYDNFSSKEDFIQTISNTNYDLILMDLFFDTETPFTQDEIAQLKIKANGGKRLVISYVNIGAAENYRYYWKDNWKLHHPQWLKKPYEGYEDEIWVKFWKKEWQDIIYGNDQSYMKKIIDAGFDGAYLDNVEAYYFLYYD